MKEIIDKEVRISYSGFVAENNRKLIASARTFNGLVKSIKRLLGDKDLVIKHVVPKGMLRIY